MRQKFAIICAVGILLSFSSIQSQTLPIITLDHVDGLYATDTLPVNQEVTFFIRITSDANNYAGITNGFRIYSPDGAEWGSLVPDTLPLGWKSMFDLGFFINNFITGSGADTVGFGGAKMFSTGLPANFDVVSYSIKIGPIDPVYHGKTIILDSSFYRNTGYWKWAGPEAFPGWDGPHQFTIFDPNAGPTNQPPVLAAIGSQSIDEGAMLTFGVSATDPDGTTPTLSTSTLPTGANFTDNGDGTGSFDWTPDFTQASVYNVTFYASDGIETDSEIVAITVNNVNQSPVLAAIGSQSIDEGAMLTINVSASDPDGDILSLDASPLPGTATFIDNGNGTGTFMWTTTFDDAGNYDVTFSASDGSLTDEEIVTITVNNINRSPVLAAIGSQSIDEGTTLTINVSASDPDGDILSLDASPLPGTATFIDNGNGTGIFEWTPNIDDAGNYDVTFTASDGIETDSEIVAITVNNINQPPVLAAIGSQSIDEGATLTINVSASDPDGDILSLDASPLPGTATFIDNGNGTGIFEWTPNIDDAGNYDVTFTASDGIETDSEIVAITVNNINQPPVLAAIGSQSIDEGTTLTINVSASDPDGDILSLDASPLPGTATFIDNGNGTGIFEWTPNIDDAGNYDVTFTASDGIETDSEIVAITVNNINQPPVLAVIGSQSIDEGAALTINVSASDPDGDILSLDASPLPGTATFIDNGDGTGTFEWTTTFDDAGDYDVTFTASDGSLTDEEIVTITVNNINQSPVLATIGSQSVIVETNLNFVVTASDPDGTTPLLSASPLPAGASFIDNSDGTGTFDWTPGISQIGEYNVTFTASDGALTDEEIVTITVIDVNHAPVLAAIGSQNVDEGSTLTINVSASDPDGTFPSLSASPLPGTATFNDNGDGTGTFEWMTTFDDAGNYDVTFTASDGSLTDEEIVTITVNNINRSPILAAIGSQSIDEGATLTINVSASDPDSDILTLNASPLPGTATFSDNGDGTGTFMWTTTFDDAGTYEVTFSASDGSLTDEEIVTITVNNINRSPVLAAIGSQSVDEGATLTISVSASDPDGDILSLDASPLPGTASFSDNGDGTGTFIWTTTFDDAGNYDVTFSSSDGDLTDEEIVTITVNNINQSPVLAAIGSQSIDEGVTLTINISASDPDSDILTLDASPLPGTATFSDNGDGTGTFVWTTTFDDAGTYDVTFSASDGDLSDDEIVTITVNNINQSPVLSAIDSQSVIVETNLNFVVTASDPDGTTPLLSASPLPAGASFIDNSDGTGTFDWTPGISQIGVYNVTFTASDGILTDEEIVTITVTESNQAPLLANIGPQTVDEGLTLTINVSASDPDGTFPSLSASPLPGAAAFNDNGDGTGTFEWTTTFDDAGNYDVTFTASDGILSDEEIVTITVNNINRSPVLAAIGSQSIDEGATLTINVSASDPDSDILTLNASPLPGTASFNDNGDGTGTFEWTTTFDDAGNYDVTFSASDGSLTDEEIVTITVNNINQPPVITSTVTDTTINECDLLEIIFTATDPDSDPISMWIDPLAENMTFVDDGAGNGTFTFDPNFNQAGVYPLTFYVSDGTDIVSISFTITVEDCEPSVEGDSISVATVPAVPGAQLMIQVDFTNICNVNNLYVNLGWTSSYINLDSANFIDSRIYGIDDKLVEIDNNNNNVKISAGDNQLLTILPGSGNLINLFFSLAVEMPAGFYPIELYNDPVWFGLNPQYNRDCGGGSQDIQPIFIPGGIVVDTSGNYVCGYVVDTSGLPIPDAAVELWDDFPGGSVVMSMQSSGNGVFSFDNFTTIPFDLWAYKDGYYPGKVENINFTQSGIMIVLTPYDAVDFSNTWAIFQCQTNTYLGAPLPVGSVIDAYARDSVRCGNFIVNTAGVYGPLIVYGEDLTELNVQGARPGDIIRFYINGIEAIPDVTPIWTESPDVAQIICLDVPNEISHTCQLITGWNLISWNVETDTNDIQEVLSSIEGCLELVMGFEQGALVFDPALPIFSDLWEVDHLSGYWVKVSCDIELDVTGSPVPSWTTIPVTVGWNLVSYLPDYTLPTPDALATIHDDLIIAMSYENSEYSVYVPGDDIYNDLLEMNPCLGYWVKVRQDGNLVYPGQGLPLATQPNKNIQANLSSNIKVKPTTSWINLYSYNLKLNGSPINAGSEIAALTDNGTVAGIYNMKENGLFGFMPVYGDDPTSEEVEGLTSGETFYLTVNGIKTEERFVWSSSGEKLEINNLTAKTASEEPLPVSFGLHQNYPNPFNPSTIISFTLPEAGKAKIEVFNLLGMLVATVFDGKALAGLNEVVWDGIDIDGKAVASGIYFYRLSASNYTETKKMMLLK